MANTIRIKRRPSSGSAGSPSAASLYNGELAFNENDNTLYYAYGSGVGGISTAVPAIAGSGAYALRGGTNATGTWPIGITGNSATVTNGVYTTGDQTVGGQKTFSASPVVSGNLAGQLVFKSANAVNGGNIIFDGANLGSETSYIKSSTAGMDITHGTKIQLNSALEVLASNTSSNSVGYFAVFDSNPASSLTTLKSVSKDQILDDIGAATSGLILTAGSGLVGGGSLSTNRAFDIGQGDGITVSTDSIAVNSTVVRTTGTQDINGRKTFGDRIIISHTGSFNNIPSLNINGGGDTYFNYYTGQLGVSSGYLLAGMHSDTSTAPFRITFDLVGGAAAITNGEWRASTIAVDKGGTGQTSYSNGQLLIGSGTSLAANTLTQGDGVTITNGSGTIGIAVDSTVVRTTGAQTINGVKTFKQSINAVSGINVNNGDENLNYKYGDIFTVNFNDTGYLLRCNNTNNTNRGQVDINAKLVMNVPSNGLVNPFIIDPYGYTFPGDSQVSAAVTSGYWRASTIQVDKGGTGQTSYSNGQLLIGSGTSLAANTLTQGSNVQITNGSGTITIAATGLALSSRTLTAGSGLVGGGDLSSDKTFDIGQGDGISVSSNSIAVDSTVVRTTGTQTINGSKTFGNTTTFNSGIISSSIQSIDGGSISITDNIIIQSAITSIEYNPANGEYAVFYDLDNVRNTFEATNVISILANNTSVSGTYFPVWTTNPDTSAEIISSRTASQLKGDIGLGNVENTSLSSVTFTAGSGLVGGGTLASSRTFNIGQGDGISVSADSIAVDNTVVRSTSVNVSGYIPTWAATNSQTLNVGYQVSTSLDTNNSSIYIPRADAVKTYVDSMIGSGIATNDAMIFKGAIDCSTNPNYPAADRGWTYKVSVAGKIGGASGPTVEVNDTLICSTDGASAGTHAVVGSNWIILQTNIADASILVTGPTSATSGNIALFDGTTGKIIKDAGFAATTVGQNLVSLTNPSATTFIKVNSNNTVSTESASTFRTSLGANTVGSNIFTLTNPSAISFLRINADNTVTARSASDFKTDLSLNNVENTALSTWAGSTSITTLGTIATGTWSATDIAVNKGGTGQNSYTNGQLLIGNSTGNTLTKATLTQGTAIDITNGTGSITIGHNDTSTLTGAQGSNGIASFTVDGMGHVTAVTTATYLTAGTVCAAIVDCTLDGGTF